MAGNRVRLTKATVAELLPNSDGSRKDYYCDAMDNFGVRVSSTSKKYFVMKLVGRQRVRVTIGNASSLSVDEARRRARVEIGKLETGINPNDEKRIARVKGITFQEAYRQYQAARRLKPRTIETMDGLFNRYLSDWLKRPLEDLDREQVSKRHKEIAAGRFRQETANSRATPTTAADNAMRAFRTVYNFIRLDNEETLPANPTARLSSRREWFGTKRRKRIIPAEKLPAWWRSVQDLENPTHRDYLVFLLLTGLRREEGAQLLWEHVDLEGAAFTVIEERAKNSEELRLPLVPVLVRMLKLRREMFKGEYVFPGRGVPYIANPGKSIKLVADTIGMHWSSHDLRRTFITMAESLDLSPYVVKALVNHKLPAADVTAGYINMTVARLRDPMQRICDEFLRLAKVTSAILPTP